MAGMVPIRKLLDRIVWDREFGRGAFEIGYLDRVAGGIVRVAFSELVIEPGNRDSFLARDASGNYQRIPLHRVREVVRNGECIWQRPDRS